MDYSSPKINDSEMEQPSADVVEPTTIASDMASESSVESEAKEGQDTLKQDNPKQSESKDSVEAVESVTEELDDEQPPGPEDISFPEKDSDEEGVDIRDVLGGHDEDEEEEEDGNRSHCSSQASSYLEDSFRAEEVNPNLPLELTLRDGSILHIRDTVAIQIAVYTSGRLRSVGKMQIVTRSKSLSRDEWYSCFRLIANISTIVLVMCQLFGPVSTLVLLILLPSLPRKYGTGDWRSFCKNEFGSIENVLESISLVSMTCFLWITSTWIIPRIVGWIMKVVCVLVSGYMTWFHGNKLLSYWPRLDTHEWRFPKPQYPKVINYDQDQISDMLALRENLLNCPAWARKMRDISMGSYWVETVCSALLHREIYNSREARRALYYFLTYLLPVIFTFQVVGIIRPWMNWSGMFVMGILRTDYLVVAGQWLVQISAPLTPIVVVRGAQIIWWPIYYVSSMLAVLGRWLTPFDEAIIYARAKLQPFMRLAAPFLGLFEQLVARITDMMTSVQQPLLAIIKFFSSWASRLRNADVTLNTMQGNETVNKLYHDPLNTAKELGSRAVANVIAVASPVAAPSPATKQRRKKSSMMSEKFGETRSQSVTPAKRLFQDDNVPTDTKKVQ